MPFENRYPLTHQYMQEVLDASSSRVSDPYIEWLAQRREGRSLSFAQYLMREELDYHMPSDSGSSDASRLSRQCSLGNMDLGIDPGGNDSSSAVWCSWTRDIVPDNISPDHARWLDMHGAPDVHEGERIHRPRPIYRPGPQPASVMDMIGPTGFTGMTGDHVTREADERAEELLRAHLTEEQRRQLDEQHAFVMRSELGRTYRISRGRVRNIAQLNEDGKGIAILCAHPTMHVPDPDTMLAQKLMLETDEDSFRRIANISSY